MADMFDYLEWRGDLSFQQASLNMVDSLLFSCMSYVVLDGIVGGLDDGVAITIEQAATQFSALPENKKQLRDKNDERILLAMAQSERFARLTVQYYVQQLDKNAEKQFSAITIALDDGSHFIAYRGTDHSVDRKSVV